MVSATSADQELRETDNDSLTVEGFIDLMSRFGDESFHTQNSKRYGREIGAVLLIERRGDERGESRWESMAGERVGESGGAVQGGAGQSRGEEMRGEQRRTRASNYVTAGPRV